MPASVCPIFDEQSAFIGIWALDRNFHASFGTLAELMSLAEPTLKALAALPQRRILNESVDVGNGVRFEGGVFVMLNEEKAPNEELSRPNSQIAYVLIDNRGIACLMRTRKSDPRLQATDKDHSNEGELWETLEMEWKRVIGPDNHCIPRPTGQEDYFLKHFSWTVSSRDGTAYQLTLSSQQWDALSDGRAAIKVELSISSGVLKGQGRGGLDKVLSKNAVIPALPGGPAKRWWQLWK
jgi:hypothetical protein